MVGGLAGSTIISKLYRPGPIEPDNEGQVRPYQQTAMANYPSRAPTAKSIKPTSTAELSQIHPAMLTLSTKVQSTATSATKVYRRGHKSDTCQKHHRTTYKANRRGHRVDKERHWAGWRMSKASPAGWRSPWSPGGTRGPPTSWTT